MVEVSFQGGAHLHSDCRPGLQLWQGMAARWSPPQLPARPTPNGDIAYAQLTCVCHTDLLLHLQGVPNSQAQRGQGPLSHLSQW